LFPGAILVVVGCFADNRSPQNRWANAVTISFDLPGQDFGGAAGRSQPSDLRSELAIEHGRDDGNGAFVGELRGKRLVDETRLTI